MPSQVSLDQVLDDQRILVGHGNGCGIYKLSDGGKVWAFGHRFLGVGSTALPFARSEVVARSR